MILNGCHVCSYRVMPKHGAPDPPRRGRSARRGEPSRSELELKNNSKNKSQGGKK